MKSWPQAWKNWNTSHGHMWATVVHYFTTRWLPSAVTQGQLLWWKKKKIIYAFPVLDTHARLSGSWGNSQLLPSAVRSPASCGASSGREHHDKLCRGRQETAADPLIRDAAAPFSAPTKTWPQSKTPYYDDKMFLTWPRYWTDVAAFYPTFK